MSDILSHADIHKSLTDFATAIRLDQNRVDAMPATSFHPMYNAEMWREWRANHVAYIEQLLSCVDVIPKRMLVELTRVATSYDPIVVQSIVLENFADVVSGSYSKEEFATAGRFFGLVIKEVERRASARHPSSGAKDSLALWLSVVDPLRIARDPECQYRVMELC